MTALFVGRGARSTPSSRLVTARIHSGKSPNSYLELVSLDTIQEDGLTEQVSAERVQVPEYAMALAHVASLRSEDPFRKVGAVALDFDNRVIGTAYNGLAPGYDPPPGFWDDRDKRQRFMLHAEINLCSLFRRGEAKLVASTTMPCTACMQTLCAYGIREVYYRDIYHESHASEIAELYGVRLEQVSEYPLQSFAENQD